MGSPQKKQVPRLVKEVTIRGKDNNEGATYICGPPGSVPSNRITLYPGDAETIVTRGYRALGLTGNEYPEMPQIVSQIGVLQNVQWAQVDFEFPDTIQEQEELDTAPYKFQLVGIIVNDLYNLPRELSPYHYFQFGPGPTPFDYELRILVWRLQAFCPDSTLFIEEVWSPGQEHLLTPRGFEQVLPKDWERSVRDALKHLKQLLYFNIEKDKQLPRAGRRPGSRLFFNSRDELKTALIKAIKHQHQHGRHYTEDAIAEYFSGQPNSPSCSGRQIRRWIKTVLGTTWQELIEEALSS